jgi:membrane associated rhomboid family serine protease
VSLLDDILRLFGTNRVRLRWRGKALGETWDRFWNPPKRKAYEHKACPRCGHPASKDETRCASCGADLPSVAVLKASRAFEWLVPAGLPLGTMAFLAACGALYFVTVKVSYDLVPEGKGGFAPNGWVLLRYGANASWLETELGEWWRLVTAVFLHGGVIHIGFNALGIWVAGQAVEEYFGRARLVVVFLATGTLGNLVSTAYHLQSGDPLLGVGASGAVFGLIGCMVGHAARRRGATARELRARFVPWLIYGLIAGFLMDGIDNAAHIGGLLSGLVFGALLGERDRAHKLLPDVVWMGLALAAIAGTALCFWLVATHPIPPLVLD